MAPPGGPRSWRGQGAVLAACGALLLSMAGCGWVNEGKAWYDGVQAYVYGCPLLMMGLTRAAGTATARPGEFAAPTNQFAVMTKYPGVDFRAVPRTGLDTLLATARADLEQEPLVLSVPDTSDRYYVIALFDMWSNVFASIGKRTTGTGAGHYLIAGPRWHGTPPADVKQVFCAPTRFVWVNGQMLADGPKGYAIVNALQIQYKLTPLSAWGQPYAPPAEVAVAPGVDTKTLPLAQVQTMDAAAYFGRLARLLKDNPPAAADAPMVQKPKALVIEPGKDFDVTKLDAYVAKGLQRAMDGFGLLEKGVKKLKTDNGWIVMPKDMGSYGTDYETRAGIAFVGLGAIQPVDIAYPTAFDDGDGKPLDASQRYVLHYPAGQKPPARVTWSLSMYDPQGYYVPNAIDRFHLAAGMALKDNPDGSLDLYIQSDSPGPDRQANWLPAPKSGSFNLVLRMFWPRESMLDGSYKVPPVRKVS
jgi:hypothetical protein